MHHHCGFDKWHFKSRFTVYLTSRLGAQIVRLEFTDARNFPYDFPYYFQGDFLENASWQSAPQTPFTP